MDIFPPGAMDFFDTIRAITGGRATAARLVLDSPGLLADPDQATVVRKGSAHTAGNDVMVSPALWSRADSVNYHYDGCPSELIEIICPPDIQTQIPASMAMIIMHELGHVTIHPKGESEVYGAQQRSLPIPESLRGQVMNILSDLVLNHNVMHGANLLGTDDEDLIRSVRTKAIHGLADLYMGRSCSNEDEHRALREAGTLPDTRYRPIEPCTAHSDPDPDGVVHPCPFAADGRVHDIGCLDNHFVDAADPGNTDNFSVPGPNTPPWQSERGHGRGPQYYPMASTAVRYGLPDRFRKVRLGRSRPDSPYHDHITVHNCRQCGNIWYQDDPAYTDVSLGSFDSPQPSYADGSVCPGRVPWDEPCGSTDTTTWRIDAGHDFLVTDTHTWDDRSAGDTGIHGMEPIWAVTIMGGTGNTRIRESAMLPRINLSYLDHLCPDCGSPTEDMYGGAFRAWRRMDPGVVGLRTEYQVRSQGGAAEAKTIRPIYFQQLMMHQWACIYATMRDLDNDLVLLNDRGNRLAAGLSSARRFIKLFGIDCARDNRGV